MLRPITFIVAAILIFGILIDAVGLALTAITLTVLRRLCAARRQARRDDPARRRPRALHRGRVRLPPGTAAAGVVGPLDGLRRFSEPGDRLRRGGVAEESRLRAARLSPRHADRRLARHRADPDHRDAAADHVRARAAVLADHAGRHLLRRAIWRLDHLYPGEHPRRSRLDRHLPRRSRDGEAGPRRRRARSGRLRLVFRRLRRHRLHRGVRPAAGGHRAGVQLARLFFAHGARARHRGDPGARLGDQGAGDGARRPAARSGRHRRQQRPHPLYVRRFRAVGRHRLSSPGDRHVRHRRDHPQSGAADSAAPAIQRAGCETFGQA